MVYYKYVGTNVNKREIQHKTGFELLQKLMHNEYGSDIIESDITLDPNGKPCFAYYRNIFFNISHCDGLCCVIVIADGQCGIDCEKVRDYRPNVIRRVFTEDEAKWFDSLPHSDKKRFFFILWTLKEAYGKYTGKGIGDMKNVSFSFENNKLVSNKTQLDFYVYEDEGYIMSLCVNKSTAPDCFFGKRIY